MSARWGLALFLGLPALFVVGLVVFLPRDGDLPPAPDEREVARVDSPDGRRTATLAEIAGTAPAVDGYVVRVGGEEAFALFGGPRPTVRWRDARTLEVAYGWARTVRKGRVEGVALVVRERVSGGTPAPQ